MFGSPRKRNYTQASSLIPVGCDANTNGSCYTPFRPVGCNICLEDQKAGESLHVTHCGHEFCKSCLNQWLNSNNTCPICRDVLPLTENQKRNHEIEEYDVAQSRWTELHTAVLVKNLLDYINNEEKISPNYPINMCSKYIKNIKKNYNNSVDWFDEQCSHLQQEIVNNEAD